MATAPTLRRFRSNPVEIAILCVVTALFGHSLYRLVQDSTTDRTAMLSSVTTSPATDGGRKPASVSETASNSPLASFSFKCTENPAIETSAQKFRLGGQICAPSEGTTESLPRETRIVNDTNHFAATVFQDSSTQSFTTDYIPLNPGQNQIRVEFVYKGGKSVAQQMSVNKNR